ncbi:MAG: hypothetical protein FJX02_07075 [Alphaproteobacteria bacterium]|nr:hypothetical protein [Alphaproteobacteria bacterium]
MNLRGSVLLLWAGIAGAALAPAPVQLAQTTDTKPETKGAGDADCCKGVLERPTGEADKPPPKN